MAVLLSAASFASAAAADVGSFDAATGTLTYDVAANSTNVETQAFSSYGSVTKVVKSGEGMLTISDGDNSTFAGTVEIVNGFFNIASANRFGATTSKICVRTGDSGSGQLYLSLKSGGQNSKHIYSSIYIAGSGPNGKGAIYAANGGMGDTLLAGTVYLDADATIGGWSRIGYYAALQDHTLTDAVSAEHICRGASPGSGHIVYVGAARFVVSGNLGGSKDNTLTISKSGATVCFWDSGTAPVWTLKADESVSISGGAGNAETKNRWGGPVVVAKGRTLTLSSYNKPDAGISVGVMGPISGEGAVKCASYSGLNAYLTGENTYEGGTTVSSGTLWANANKSIPETGSIAVSGGQLHFNVEQGKWTADEVRKRISHVAAGSGSVNFYTASGKMATDNGEGFSVGAAGALVGHAGAGTYVTSGDVTGGATLYSLGSGLWRITSKTIDAPKFYLNTGKVALEDAGCVWTSDQVSEICGNSTTLAHLVVSNTVVGGKTTTGGNNWGARMKIGCAGGQRGVVEVTGDRAALTNYLNLGEAAKSAGAVWQDGGTVLESCTSTADGSWGRSGYGAYDLTGGTLTIGHCNNLGRSTAGVGILRIAGDDADVKFTGTVDLFVGSGGTGVVHQTKGKLAASGTVRLGQREWATETPGGHSEYTLDGGTASIGSLCLGQRPAPAYSVLNVNGGQLTVGRSLFRWAKSGNTTFFTAANQPASYVNFNGGAIGPSVSSALFAADELSRPTKVTVYEGGVTIDVTKANSTVNVPLEAPNGLGVVSISLPQNCPATGWIGPQHVVIRGGSGYGATAITDFDRKTMSISKVIVTSPGQGYAEGDVVTATIPNVGNSAALACASVRLGPVPSGGLTLRDASESGHVCSICCVNTYTGATVVAGGTLKLDAEAAIASSRAVRVAADATLDLNSNGSLTVDSFGGAGTVKNGGARVERELVFDAAEVAAGKAMKLTGKLTLADGVKVRIANAEPGFPTRSRTVLTAEGGIAGDVAKHVDLGAASGDYEWSARVRGNSVRLVCGRGMVLFIR